MRVPKEVSKDVRLGGLAVPSAEPAAPSVVPAALPTFIKAPSELSTDAMLAVLGVPDAPAAALAGVPAVIIIVPRELSIDVRPAEVAVLDPGTAAAPPAKPAKDDSISMTPPAPAAPGTAPMVPSAEAPRWGAITVRNAFMLAAMPRISDSGGTKASSF
jgi:hypothetical protein